MFSFVNRTVFDIPLTWNRNRFAASRAKCRKAKKLIEISINAQYAKQLRCISNQNLDIENMITEINKSLVKHEKKHCIIEKLTVMASESLPNHLDKRMEKVRTSIQEHFKAIQKVLREENIYWNEIRSAIEQNLITSEDFHAGKTNSQIIIINKSENSLRSMAQLSMNAGSTKSAREDRIGICSNRINSNKIIPSINKTYVVQLNETTTTETNETSPMEIFSDKPTARTHESPIHSQPNPPAPLCFSPTILQDERTDSTKNILSPLDENIIVKPKVILNRVSQEVLSEYLKLQHNYQTENMTSPIQTKFSDSIQRKSNIIHDHVFAVPEPVSKHRSRKTKKDESQSIHSIKTTSQTRKRKQSVSEDANLVLNTRNLRTRKPMSFAEVEEPKTKRRAAKKGKPRKTKENKMPIREPSPLPTIDRLSHYSTRFSTRSQRSNNFTLSMYDIDSDKENDKTKTRSQRRKKFTKRICNQSKNSSISVKNKKKST